MPIADRQFGVAEPNRLKRIYVVPQYIADLLAKMPVNRSAAIAMSISAAHHDPNKLVKALAHRINHPKAIEKKRSDAVSITMSLSPSVVDQLDALSELTQMTLEQTLRLSVEAYIFKL